MINKSRIFGMLGLAAKAGKIAFGSEMCEEQIYKNKIKILIISVEASERTKNKFISLCESKKIPIINIGTIDEISKSVGKENKAVIGVKDINFKNAILKIINGGEVIG